MPSQLLKSKGGYMKVRLRTTPNCDPSVKKSSSNDFCRYYDSSERRPIEVSSSSFFPRQAGFQNQNGNLAWIIDVPLKRQNILEVVGYSNNDYIGIQGDSNGHNGFNVIKLGEPGVEVFGGVNYDKQRAGDLVRCHCCVCG
jgi:hypothetical protein